MTTVNAKTILIIEDEVDLCDILKYRLESIGYSVQCAHDGKTGITIIRDNPPHLVILDLMLPRLNGESVCKAVRENDKTEHIPIIMLTAKGKEVDKIIGKVIGANTYITKPFDMAVVLTAVRTLLDS